MNKLKKSVTHNLIIVRFNADYCGEVCRIRGGFDDTGDIQAKIEAIEAVDSEQNTGMGTSIAASGDTKAIIKRLKANHRTLKGIAENILEVHGDAGLIAEWDSACKIEKKKSPPPATPPTT